MLGFLLGENYVLCFSSDLFSNFPLANIIHVTALIYAGTLSASDRANLREVFSSGCIML